MTRKNGFSLIEILIVLVVVAVIAMVAIPSYLDSVQKARRTDGRNALLALQVNQEKYRANCAQYGASIGASDVCTTGSYTLKGSTSSTEGYYTVAITGGSASATGYVATATATGAQAGDTNCPTLTLTVSNVSPEGAYTPADCW